MNETTVANATGIKVRPKRHSPVFLAVFAIFLVATGICAGGALLAIAGGKLEQHDTRWYWSSARLLVRHQNPYDEAAVRNMQISAGIPPAAIGNDVVRNPPPTLVFIAPLGFFAAGSGVWLWSLSMAACVVLSMLLMSRMLKDPGFRLERWYLQLMWFFAPVLACVASGQTGVLLLLGLAAFLLLHERQPFWAGVALSICGAKPHLFLPFGVVLLCWIVFRRRWMLLAGALLSLAIESAVVMWFDPSVWGHYSAAMRSQGIQDLYVPTFGVALRFLVNRSAMWLEFVPAGVGCAWALWYFLRHRRSWDWRTHGSLVTLISLVVAPYSWLTDTVIVLPAMLFVMLTAKPPRRGSTTLLLAAMAITALDFVTGHVFYFRPNMLLPLLWLAVYLYAASEHGIKSQRLNGGCTI